MGAALQSAGRESELLPFTFHAWVCFFFNVKQGNNIFLPKCMMSGVEKKM